MRTEREAEMDGFKKGLDMQINIATWTYLAILVIGFLAGFTLGRLM